MNATPPFWREQTQVINPVLRPDWVNNRVVHSRTGKLLGAPEHVFRPVVDHCCGAQSANIIPVSSRTGRNHRRPSPIRQLDREPANFAAPEWTRTWSPGFT
jgi:hypothetical protein